MFLILFRLTVVQLCLSVCACFGFLSIELYRTDEVLQLMRCYEGRSHKLKQALQSETTLKFLC